MGALTRWRPRLVASVVGLGLLGSLTAAIHGAAVERPEARPAELPNFHLVDTAGQSHSIESFPAETVLVIYFGYTTCLRACPTTLDTIAAAIDELGARAASVRPLFIDLDPDRAAQANLPLYMQSFGPSFLGLTGSPAAIAEAAQDFDVQVERLQFSADPTDYAMTHVSPIFVMRPGDAHPSALPATISPEDLAAALRLEFDKPPAA